MCEDANHCIGHKKTLVTPGKFDGTGLLESFLAEFEVCAQQNNFTSTDKVDFLRSALDKAATQLFRIFMLGRILHMNNSSNF